jgi:hypothetical protein
LILVVCISNGEIWKTTNCKFNVYFNGKDVYTCIVSVFDVFNIQSYSQTTKSVSLNWQHLAIVEYVMLKLVSNVPPSEIRAGIWMYLSKQCIVLHTFPAHCISTFIYIQSCFCNSTSHVQLKYSTFIVP